MQVLLETYWQPRLTTLNENLTQTYLGYICAGGYVATTAGCFLMGRVKPGDGRRRWAAYLGIGFGLCVLIFLLSFQTKTMWFAFIYTAIYLAIGLISVPEQTIVNTETSDDVRASMLSVVSFAARLGGMLSSIASSALLLRMDISTVWLLSALVTMACVTVVAVMRIIAYKRQLQS